MEFVQVHELTNIDCRIQWRLTAADVYGERFRLTAAGVYGERSVSFVRFVGLFLLQPYCCLYPGGFLTVRDFPLVKSHLVQKRHGSEKSHAFSLFLLSTDALPKSV